MMMDQPIKDSLIKKDLGMDLVCYHQLMVLLILVSGRMIYIINMELIFILMVRDIKDKSMKG